MNFRPLLTDLIIPVINMNLSIKQCTLVEEHISIIFDTKWNS